MKSRRAKVLHEAGGKPLIGARGGDGAGAGAAGAHFRDRGAPGGPGARPPYTRPACSFVQQAEQRGTGHALMIVARRHGAAGRPAADSLRRLPPDLRRHAGAAGDEPARSGAAGTIVTAMMDDPTGYGRVVRQGDGTVAGDRGAEGRHARATGHPRSQHGDLLLPRGPVLEARRARSSPTTRPRSIT